MKPINRKAQKVMERLAKLAANNGGSVKIDNAEGTYMALCVEILPRNQISLAHYGEQNGDLMCDPEMVFWKAGNGRYYPVYYRNDYAGIERNAVVKFDSAGIPLSYYRGEQASEATFAGTWLENVRHQQGV